MGRFGISGGRMLRKSWLLTAWLAAATPAIAADPGLADDLCNFPVAGLTLDSSPNDVRQVFAPRGWVDESTGPSKNYATRKMFQEVYFRDTPSTQPLATAPRYFFKLTITEGVGTGITFRDAAPDAPARLRAACAQLAGRFQTSGCDRNPLGERWQIRVLPFPGTLKSYCQLQMGVLESQPSTMISISVSRFPGSPALLNTGKGAAPPR